MRKLITQQGLHTVADALDRLTNLDVPVRGSIGTLFEGARGLLDGKPMSLAVVELLEKSVKPGDFVFITTGWADQPINIATKSETDGPPGAAALARAIRLTLKGLPIIVTDDYLVEDMKVIMRSSGFHINDPDKLENSLSTKLGFACVPSVAVIGMPIDQKQCEIESKRLMDLYKPACCIAIERGAMNRHGRIHGMGGYDFSETQAKMDYFFTEAKTRGVPTVGIGDGGNEIGMANIESLIREKINNGNSCNCPCQAGIAPDVATVDVLVSATISNWGGYGIASLLALSQGDLNAMCSTDLEARVLNACAQVEFHDSIGSRVAPSVDGCEALVHFSVINLILKIISMGISRYPCD